MEALVNLEANKQHLTPVWNMPDKAYAAIQGDECIAFSLLRENLPDFPFKDKSEDTFIYYNVPKDKCKYIKYSYS